MIRGLLLFCGGNMIYFIVFEYQMYEMAVRSPVGHYPRAHLLADVIRHLQRLWSLLDFSTQSADPTRHSLGTNSITD